ncbi:sensor histidine kinase [Shewanella baltica]|uniref:sensor histidine kinase n=1 Tax=Shewanella baltica TaxID=62322 RepID=UPI00325EE46F
MNKFSVPLRLRPSSSVLSQCIISAIFIALLVVLAWSLENYWQHTLKPRLYLAAKTQANVLAQSQSAVIVETLEHNKPLELATSLRSVVQEMLIVEDPAIGTRYIRGLTLQFDYDLLGLAPGSLDFHEGDAQCVNCFLIELPLITSRGDLLGIANVAISDGYFRTLSNEMQSRLFAESGLTFGLLVAVWLVMMLMFHRLHAAKHLLEASDRAKTRFMANITHELRTPLNAILGYTQLYKDDPALMDNYRQGIDSIDRSADHLLSMINDILEFSRADEDSVTFHPSEVSLTGFLGTLVEMIRLRAQLQGLDFKVRFDEKLPAEIRVDEKRLRQILLNLLSNAVKFTPSGEVVFSVTQQKTRTQGHCRLHFSVTDSGIGIARNQLKDIFIPFQQLDNPITRAEGSGLGLSISQRLIALMGGKLRVSSRQDVGSRFWFELEFPCRRSTSSATEHKFAATDTVTTDSNIRLPPKALLEELVQQAQRHDVLALRKLIQQLEQEACYQDFLADIAPFVSNYRFKLLAAKLVQYEQTP